MKKIKNTGFSFGCLLLMTLLVSVHFVQAEKKDPPASPQSNSNSGGSRPQTRGDHQSVTTSGNKTTISGVGTIANGQSYSYSVTNKDSNNSNNNNNNNGGGKKPATGYFDTVTPATCRVSGWAYDPDNSAVSIPVHIYRDGTAGKGTYVGECETDRLRTDVNAARKISGNHGFNCELPVSFRGTGSHTLYIHALDIDGKPNNLLLTNGKSMSCDPALACTLLASKTTVTLGETTSLSWVSTQAVGTATIRNTKNSSTFDVDPNNTAGVRSVTPTSTTRYVMAIKNSTGGTTNCERLVTVNPAPPAPDLIVTDLEKNRTCSVDEMTKDDTCLKTQIKFNLKNIGNKNISNIPYRVESKKTDGSWASIKTGTHTGTIGEGGIVPLTVDLSLLGAGESTLRIVGNPDGGLGEINTTNNISNSLTITYDKARVDLSFANLRVSDKCEASAMTNGICPKTTVSFQLQNDGNKTIQSGTIIPYVIQVYQGGTWVNTVQKLSYTYSAALTPGNKTSEISEILVNLPLGTTRIRARVNLSDDGVSARSSSYREDILVNNTSEILPALSYLYDVAKVDLKFDSSVVRYGFATKLEWTVDTQYALTCTLSGPLQSGQTFSVAPGVNKGTASSLVLKSVQAFTITCTPVAGLGVPSDIVKKTVQIEVVPQVQEI